MSLYNDSSSQHNTTTSKCKSGLLMSRGLWQRAHLPCMCRPCNQIYRHRCHGDGDTPECSAGHTDTPQSSLRQMSTSDTLKEKKQGGEETQREMILHQHGAQEEIWCGIETEVFISLFYWIWMLTMLVNVTMSLSINDFIVWASWHEEFVRGERLSLWWQII